MRNETTAKPGNATNTTCLSTGRLLLVSLLTVCLLWVLPASAQDKKIQGRVTTKTGAPVSGASVQVKGTNTGTSTNENGDFTITASRGAVLIISNVGYVNNEITVGDENIVKVVLITASQDMSEVVVVGYGTQRKKDVTGAVASVNLEALREAPNTNIGQMLQGTVPGLNVGLSTYAGGTPPISIRGINTIGGNQNVLIILDGIQFTGSLSSINPDDIASIDVLKDASSTAVYGAQAANGVILITSRKGRNNQRPRIAFSSGYTTQKPNVDLRPMNREEYLRNISEAYYNQSYIGPEYTKPNESFDVTNFVDATMRNSEGLLPNDFNWWDEGTKTGNIYEGNLSLSGGTDKFNYLLSGGYVDQKGFIMNDIFKRRSIRANLEIKALDWWKIGLVSNGSFVNQDGAEPGISGLIFMSPLQKPFDDNGKLIPFPTNTVMPNPFNTFYVDNFDRTTYLFANVYTEINPPFLKGLTYRLNFGNNYTGLRQYGASIYGANQTGEAFKRNTHYYDYTLDNILTYTKSFGDHNITATAVYGAIERRFDTTGARATGFDRLNLSYNNLALGANQFSGSGGWKEALNYQMGRINYSFDNKYLLTATIRRDGYSGFASNHKYALFPTLALGWVMSEEKFMQDLSFLNTLKLRAGYGESGNMTSRYSSIAKVTTGAAYVFGDGGTPAFGQQVAALGNPDLKWERTKGLNVGLDFSLLNNRLSGNLEYYINNTHDLLFPVSLPDITGFPNIQTNLGQLRNKGFEASISYRVIDQKDFNWTTSFNFWKNTNKVISLTGVDANKDGVEDDLISSNLFIGKPLNSIYGYQTGGIYQVGSTPLPGFFVGSMSIVDQNGDNLITPEKDRVFLGDRNPRYRFSWMNTVSYKGFSLMVFINAIQGGSDGYRGNNARSYFRDDNSIRNNDLVQVDYWSPANPGGKYPRIISGTQPAIQAGVNTNVLSGVTNQYGMWENRSFIRLQDISLSYNLGRLIKKIPFQALNLYVSGKNLVTWTDWKGWDPETELSVTNTNSQPQTVVQGLTVDGRPVMRAFTIGLNITY
ncbi:SusC/RagA family TonB-linked outer membrane protein [Pseudoflavitalea rhizosphaerae]|uniref:SusC/RagA family TonB-linked outer membrane protein n=1 Tax=Pseudoflavitalea rhizosphaerae TaxID=1884793 RepID=UPI000F8ECED6|nr:TonB-dependent receptor [Pseudoflavitalea rhizosphaerae]